jgi:hypothetical protein
MGPAGLLRTTSSLHVRCGAPTGYRTATRASALTAILPRARRAFPGDALEASSPIGHVSDIHARLAAAARPCAGRDCDERGECDGRETTIAAGLALLGLLAAMWFGVRRLRRLEPAAP